MSATTQQIGTEKLDFEKVWLMFQETNNLLEKSSIDMDKRFQETDRKFQETNNLLEKSSLDVDDKFKEAKALIEQSSIETDKRLKETDRQMKNLLKKMSESESRWGRFVEALVDGSLVSLLKTVDINVTGTLTREKKLHNGKQYEIDIIAKNGNDLVAVEVKTTLSPQDVDYFVNVLNVIKEVFPEYSEKKIVGAVGYINEDSKAHIYAENQGLLVIKAVGESAKLVNSADFKPKIW